MGRPLLQSLLLWFTSYRSRIGDRIAILVIIFGVCASLVSTAYHLILEYRHHVAHFQKVLDNIEYSILPSLSSAVWTLDLEQINRLLNGLVQRPEIAYAAILTNDTIQWERGAIPRSASAIRENLLTHEFHGRQVGIGTFRVATDSDEIYAHLAREGVSIFLTKVLETFAIAFFLLILLYRLVANRLVRLNNHVSGLHPRSETPPLKFIEGTAVTGDELDQIAASINSMHQESHRAFRDLQDREQKMRLFFDASTDGIFSVDASMRLTFVNESWVRHMGCGSSDEALGKPLDTLLHWSCEQDDKSQNMLLEVIQSNISITRKICWLHFASGRSLPVTLRAYPLLRGSQCYGVVVFFSDESRQIALENELLLLGEAINQSPVVVVVSDREGRISYVNPGFERITGYRREEVMGRKPTMLDKSKTELLQYDHIRKNINDGRLWRGHLKILCKNGTSRTMETVITPMVHGGDRSTNLVVVAQDVTSEIALRNQLQQVQKMEAIGRLAASVAHEFGNPLFGIRCLLHDLKQRGIGTREDQQALEVAVSECDRIKELIRSLRLLHHPALPPCGSADANDVIRRMVTLHEQYLNQKKVRCILLLSSQGSQAAVPEHQLMQVLVNLLLNALDAMADTGGELTIASSCTKSSCVIRVSDTGQGIAEELRSRVFEPFFSTKSQVEGAGLGLSVSYGIVAALGGDLVIESSSELGTTFAMTLPRASTDIQAG